MEAFKKQSSVAQNDWLTSDPAKPLTIHDLVRLVNTAYSAEFSFINIIPGYSKPGSLPFYRSAFGDEGFEPAFVTDHEPQEPREGYIEMNALISNL